MRGLRAAAAAAGVLAVVLSGCGTGGTPSGGATPTPSVPAPTTPVSPTAAPTSTPATAAVNVYFVRADRLVTAHREPPAPGGAVATAAMRELLRGPNPFEKGVGVTSAIPAGTQLNGISLHADTATVDLSSGFATGGTELSRELRSAQVVFTLTQFPTVHRVEFRLDGHEPEDSHLSGIPEQEVGRADYEHVLPAIFVESPGVGDAVRSPVHVTGTANVFEAVFTIEITDWDGRIVATKAVQASSGTGTRGSFDVLVPYSADRSGLGELIVSSTSPKDGSRINVVEIPLHVNS